MDNFNSDKINKKVKYNYGFLESSGLYPEDTGHIVLLILLILVFWSISILISIAVRLIYTTTSSAMKKYHDKGTYGGLNNAFYRLIYFNVWFPVGGLFKKN